MSEPSREMRDGVEVLVYDSGLVREVSTGRILAPPEASIIRSPERGRELFARRMSLARQRAREGIDAGAGIPLDRQGGGEGWAILLEHAARTFLQSKNLRGMGESLSKMGQAAGYITTDDEAMDSSAAMEAIAQLASVLRSLIPRETVIDAEVQDEER